MSHHCFAEKQTKTEATWTLVYKDSDTAKKAADRISGKEFNSKLSAAVQLELGLPETKVMEEVEVTIFVKGDKSGEGDKRPPQGCYSKKKEQGRRLNSDDDKDDNKDDNKDDKDDGECRRSALGLDIARDPALSACLPACLPACK